MQCGYVKLWRSVMDCGLMQRPVEFTLFSYLLMRAMHEPVRYGIAGGVVDIPVGGFISSPEKLGSELSLTRQVVRTAIKNLEKMQILTTKSTNKFTLYVIDNYAKYQGANQQTNQQTNQQVTINQPAVNQQLTTNIELNNINIKESKEEESINSKALAAEPPPVTPKKSPANKLTRPPDVCESVWEDFLIHRKGKRAPVTQSAVDGIRREADKAGITLASALIECCSRGWSGFKAEWLQNASKPNGRPSIDEINRQRAAGVEDWINEGAQNVIEGVFKNVG